jgi:hypothetical protein
MRRRDFIALLGSAAAWPLAVRAQQPDMRARALLSRILQLEANGIADKIAVFLDEVVSQIGWTTQLPWSAGTLEQRRFDALRLLRQVPAVTQLAFLDASGAERLKVSRVAMDVAGAQTDFSQDPKFSEAVAHMIYYGPVHLLEPERCESGQADVQETDAIDGLGIYVTATNGQIRVVAPIQNMPAAKAGIVAGDIIVALDGAPVQGLTLGQVVERMRGPVNTSIKLTVMRSEHDAPIEFSVTRDVIREGTRVGVSRCLPVSQPATSRGTPYLTLSLAGTRREAGVSVAEVNLTLVWDVIRQLKIGEHEEAYVLDAQDRVIGHSAMFNPVLDPQGTLYQGDFSLFQRDFSSLSQVRAARAADPDASREMIQAGDINGREVLAASARIVGPKWLVLVELPVAAADTAVP